jgi:hypothetical protein
LLQAVEQVEYQQEQAAVELVVIVLQHVFLFLMGKL